MEFVTRIRCKDIFPNKSDVLKRRKFNDLEVERIKEILGTKPESIWKADLVQIVGTDYKTIRECIRKSPTTYGISENTYRRLSKLPPKVAQGILDALG